MPGDYRRNQARDWGTSLEDDYANARREALDEWYERWNARVRGDAEERHRRMAPLPCSECLVAEVLPAEPIVEIAVRRAPPPPPPQPIRRTAKERLQEEIDIAVTRFEWPTPAEAETIAARFPHLDATRAARLARALFSKGAADDGTILAELEAGRSLPLVERMHFYVFLLDRARPCTSDARHAFWRSIVTDVTRHRRSVFARAVALILLHCSRLSQQKPSSLLLHDLQQFLAH